MWLYYRYTFKKERLGIADGIGCCFARCDIFFGECIIFENVMKRRSMDITVWITNNCICHCKNAIACYLPLKVQLGQWTRFREINLKSEMWANHNAVNHSMSRARCIYRVPFGNFWLAEEKRLGCVEIPENSPALQGRKRRHIYSETTIWTPFANCYVLFFLLIVPLSLPTVQSLGVILTILCSGSLSFF